MKSVTHLRTKMYYLLGAAALCFGFAVFANAQVSTEKSVTPQGAPTTTVKVERGTIVYVNGNDVVIKAEDGTLRDFNNVPDSVTVTVGGKQLNVHQLQPGMQVERQTITTTSPKLITTIKTVSGVVWQVNPPNWVILKMDNNTNQRFKIPAGQKFKVNDRRQEVDAFGLRKGMRIDAQQVTEVQETEVAQEVKRTGIAPPPPPPPPAADVAILILAVPVPAGSTSAAPTEEASAASAQAEPAPSRLPNTGSDFPLIGLLGVLCIALALGLKARRTRDA
jgi:LPXTG-motif cell wall-anchored protein